VMENLWRAERSGIHATLIDEATLTATSFLKAVTALLDLIAEDAAALGCEAECEQVRIIARDGSSADGQIAAFEAALKSSKNERQALSGVVDWLAQETAGGLKAS
jgi:carboxylate-amine ligase